MPTYTYVCTKCGLEAEVVQSMTDPALKRCKKCRGALRRTYHPIGIVLKGAGFHRNDYRTKRPADSTKKEESKTESKTESKSETKPESKSGSKKRDRGSGGSTERSGVTPRSKGSSSSSTSDD